MQRSVTVCDMCGSSRAQTYAILALGHREGEYVADLCGPRCLARWAARVWEGREPAIGEPADEATLARFLFPGKPVDAFRAVEPDVPVHDEGAS